MRAVIVGALLLVGAGWPTESHDVRRTGQSDVRGPRSATHVRSVVLTAEQSVNMPVTVANMIDVDRSRAAISLGLALRETGGVTRRVYASSGNGYSTLAP